MKRLMKEKPILHAVIWIMIYIGTVGVGDALSERLGRANLVTSALLIVLSLILMAYLKKNGQFANMGLVMPSRTDNRIALFYLPLFLIAILQFTAPIDPALSAIDIALGCLLMVGVGFLEELIFRGLLFQGIRSVSGMNRAIIVSGVTFGIGHIVNLLRDYSAPEQIVQVIAGIVLGIVLAMVVAITRSVLPGALFHMILNIGGTLNVSSTAREWIYLTALVAICILYALYLLKVRSPFVRTKAPVRNV